jgi:hypothetical protein
MGSKGFAGASDTITAAVLAWPGMTASTGSRGEWSFKLGRREIGHLHGDRVMHGGYAKAQWRALFEAGRIDHHPVFPGREGPASRAIESADDVQDVIALLRINYDLHGGRVAERDAA